MREIKFRGFSINKKKWVYGNYNYTFERGYLSQGYDDVPPRYYYIDTETNYYEVYSQSIGQYTGLKDKNGKEIYEGDIIQLINEDLEEIKVICEFGTAKRQIFDNLVEITGFYFKRLDDDRKTFPIINNYLGKHDLELFEVIGNIHDNPELLEVL